MSFKTSPLRDAITFALAVGATAAVGTGTAFAQETQEDKDATTLDRIEVTGTRIRQVDVETAQPVLTVTRADIDKQGFQTVGDILQNISAVGVPPISRAQPLSSGEAVGGTFISLRNIGAQRTLILVNGKRLGVTTSGLADVSTIPASAIERMEVLKDGASSIYGSDAISGVINIITRTNYEGAQAGAYFGQYSEGDGETTSANFVMGFNGERGSLTVAAEWNKEEDVRASDRPYSAFPRGAAHATDGWTVVGQQGGFTTRATTPTVPGIVLPGIAAGTRVTLRPGGNPSNPADYIAQDQNTGSCAPATVANPGPGTCTPGSTSGKSNTNEQTGLRTPQETRALYVDGVFDINDSVRFRTNLLYNNRESERFIAGFPLQATSPSSGGPAIFTATNVLNPLGVDINTWWRRLWEVPRVSNSDLTTYRFSGAFEGSFEVGDRIFDWDVGYLNQTNKVVQSGFGDANILRLRQAVGASFRDADGSLKCGTPDNPATAVNERNVIAGCTPFNPLVPEGVVAEGGLTGNTALQNWLFQEIHSTGETGTEVMSANLAGSLFSLPAGDLGFAVGVEHRTEDGKFTPDAMAATGNSTTLAAGPTQGQYSVDEIYLELQVPILADVIAAKELTLSVASRYSDFDTFGETTNNKFALKWKPIDSLLLRATYADGFRAPTIADLFGGGSQTFSFYTDPCDTRFGSAASNPTTLANCTNGVGGFGALGALAPTFRQRAQGFTATTTASAQTPVPFLSGSNAALQPELAKSQDIGFVWSPEFVEGLNVAMDWWKIRIDQTIVADTPNNILNDCYILGIAERCQATEASEFTRDPTLGYVDTLRFSTRNAGFRKVEGYDFDVTYRLKTENLGAFSIASNSTYTANDYFVSTNDPRQALSSVGSAGFFRIRSTLNLGWEKGAWGASWTARYYSGMKESCTYFTPNVAATPPVMVPHLECEEIVFAPNGNLTGTTSSLSRRHVVGSNTFNDVQVRWTAPWNATIALGANNVFDKVGPTMYSQPAANVSYYGGFDIGRFLYLKYSQRF